MNECELIRPHIIHKRPQLYPMQKQYEASLKYYRDLKNVVDTARDEGREEGREEMQVTIAKSLKDQGVSSETIANATGLSIDEINAL